MPKPFDKAQYRETRYIHLRGHTDIPQGLAAYSTNINILIGGA